MGQESTLNSSLSVAGTLSRQRTEGKVIALKRSQEESGRVVSRDHHPSLIGIAKKRRRRSADSTDDEQSLMRALRQRPWINYNESETTSDDVPYCKQASARWRPEGSCRPSLEEAPVFFPLEEEFKDTLKYIASIRAEVEPYGICRIVPPQSWCPPCPLRDAEKRETAIFPTRAQQVHKLQVREVATKRYPRIRRRKRGRPSRMEKQILEASGGAPWECVDDNDKFGFEPGPDLTIAAFEKYAHQFQEGYFGMVDTKQSTKIASKERWHPSVEDIEGEYWRIVKNANEEVEVLYGADIETTDFGSGFPKAKEGMGATQYENSGWNLNNVARLPGSCLAYEEGDISGVLIPWLYLGMCFSSFCWHVEDHHFYSLNYLHWGSPKVWYGVPSNAAAKLEEAMKKHLPDLFEEQPDLLHKLVTQLSPTVLREDGVPVYRAVQKAGEFIVTFPRAYHAGFNCGFNCAEAVNLAPIDWLPFGQSAVELYREQCRKTSVSHDKLLLSAVKQALRAQPSFQMIDREGKLELYHQYVVLTKALKVRVEIELAGQDSLKDCVLIRNTDSSCNASCERECIFCHYDLYLSAVGCYCSPGKFACLLHVGQLCRCGRENKYVLYCHDIHELENLVVDLEKRLVEMKSWLDRCNTLPTGKWLVSEASADTYRDTPMICPEAADSTKSQIQSRVHNCPVWANSEVKSEPVALLKKKATERAIGTCNDHNAKADKAVQSVTSSTSEQASQGLVSKVEKSVILIDNDKDELCGTDSFYLLVGDAMDTDKPKLGNASKISRSSSSIDKETFFGSIERNSSNELQNCHGSMHNRATQSSAGSQKHATSSTCTKYGMEVKKLPITETAMHGTNYHFSQSFASKSNISGPWLNQEFIKPSTQDCSFSNATNVVNTVELLNVGRLVLRKSWYNEHRIFPAGFKSRILFNSILDPLQMCFYVSEVVDYGQAEPLFKVALESNPSEAVVQNSMDRCWEIVQDRVNDALQLQEKDFQRRGYIQGIDLCGFTNPSIIKAIESLDLQHECREYWAGRRGAVELLKSQHMICIENRSSDLDDDIYDNAWNSNHELDSQSCWGRMAASSSFLPNVYNTLRGLFHKATEEELWAMHKIFSREWGGPDWKQGFAALKDELGEVTDL